MTAGGGTIDDSLHVADCVAGSSYYHSRLLAIAEATDDYSRAACFSMDAIV